MMENEIYDISFFLNSLKVRPKSFNILNYVAFCKSNTRSSTSLNLEHNFTNSSCARHFYFNRLPRLWNLLTPIDLTMTTKSIIARIRDIFRLHFLNNFCLVHFIFYVRVINASFHLIDKAASQN